MALKEERDGLTTGNAFEFSDSSPEPEEEEEEEEGGSSPRPRRSSTYRPGVKWSSRARKESRHYYLVWLLRPW